jgi:TolB-like protein/DNA-binding winged helix-turn-helix (wHTH) protein/Tfp pilus assembly protein PilF
MPAVQCTEGVMTAGRRPRLWGGAAQGAVDSVQESASCWRAEIILKEFSASARKAMSDEPDWRTAPKERRKASRPLGRRPVGEIPEIYKFGPFRLEPAERKLLRGNEVVALTPKAFDTLLLLVRSSGHLIEKDELIRTLWPDTVVEEGNLTTNISLLRKVLGQDPEYIETIPKKGYRFVGAVRRLPTAERAQPESPPYREGDSAAEMAEAQDAPDSVVAPRPSDARGTRRVIAGIAAATLAIAGAGFLWWHSVRVDAPSQSKSPAVPAPGSAVVFAPPPHSIAVLPFVNLSGDKEQEYFSDGLTEELLNSLAHIDGLQVAARTSSFSFSEHPDVADVARKLNVATVLEGSVRRSGQTVRVSAQLINAMTGFHLWSRTYDRDLGDVLKLQSEIATAVASSLEVTLLGDESAKIELGGTRNPAAFDAYLRASKLRFRDSPKEIEAAIAGYTEAIHLDPNYALAFAWRSEELTAHAEDQAKSATVREENEKALADARRAVALAPELAEGHIALAYLFQDALDFVQESAELERAVALAPGDAQVLGWYGRFAVMTGHTNAGIAAAHRAVVLDPLNPMTHYRLGQSLLRARRYADAVSAFSDALVLDPQQKSDSYGLRGLAYYGLGAFQSARASCEANPGDSASQWCLAVTYRILARHGDAEAALAKLGTVADDRWAYECATIYAQWGNTSRALESLEAAYRLRVPELRWLKVDPLMDPLRKEPRFQAIERALKFPT